MKVTTETVATREVELTIEPDPQTIENAMRRAAREISRYRPVAGFRPGRAPYNLVERIFGREVILHEALNAIAPELYRQAIQEANIEPYEQTPLDIESEEPLVLKLRVPLKPEVELGDYTTLTIEPEPEPVVTEEDIDEQIEMLRRQHAEIRPVDRPVQMGDQVLVLLSRTVDGEAVQRNEEVVLDLNENLEPEGLAEALEGAKTNEVREFTLTFPEDHPDENVAGKKVDYRVAIVEIREVVLPELDDEFAKTVGDYETLDDLRNAIREQLAYQKEEQARNNERRRAVEALIEISRLEYPAVALEREIDRVIAQHTRRLRQYYGLSLQGYLRVRGITEEQLRDEVRADCERNLKQRLVLAEYAQKENITLSEEEIDNAWKTYANQMLLAYQEDVEEKIREELGQGILQMIYEDALVFKASQHLADRLTGRLAATEEGQEESQETTEESTPEEEPSEESPSSGAEEESSTE